MAISSQAMAGLRNETKSRTRHTQQTLLFGIDKGGSLYDSPVVHCLPSMMWVA
jgi:hypothetical protein